MCPVILGAYANVCTSMKGSVVGPSLAGSHTDGHIPTSRLVIEDVNTGHTGLYICRATNPQINREASVFSEEIRVEVKKREVQQNTPIRQGTDNTCTFTLYIHV